MRNFRNVAIRLSENDFNCLEVLSKEQGLAKSEYFRMLIKIFWFAHEVEKGIKTKKPIEYEGYGFEFSEEFMIDFAKRMESSFEGLDIEKAIVITDKKVKKGNFVNMEERMKRAKKASKKTA